MLKAIDLITGEALGFEAVKKVVAQIRIVLTLFQEIVEDYQNGMPHGDASAFLASRQSALVASPSDAWDNGSIFWRLQ
jgi:hypothetical protein